MEYLNNTAIQIGVLLDEIPEFKRVHLNEPSTVSTNCEVAVLMHSGASGQGATQEVEDVHVQLIRVYMPRQHIETTDETMRKLWDSLRDKFTTNLTLNGTALYCNLGSYTTKYQRVGGQFCRVMDTTLTINLVIPTEFAA